MAAVGAVPGNIAAAIGPTIQQSSYEVDDPFHARFKPEDAGFFAPGRPGHWQFDLPGYVAARLRHAGVSRIESIGLDTCTRSEERRVGQECVRTCRSRWSPDP